MRKISVLSSNPRKIEELRPIAAEYGIELDWIPNTKLEIQADDPSEVAKVGAVIEYSKLKKPLIVEDSGFFIDALNGMPGIYASQTYKSIGLRGILRLLRGKRNRNAHFKASICYVDGKGARVFEGIVKGKIAKEIHKGRRFGYDPIFIPAGYSKTFSELGIEKKNRLSHRANAFRKFAKYFTPGKRGREA